MKRSIFQLILLGVSFVAFGQENLSQEQVEFFEEKIRPALVKYCYECHSEESGKTKGGLLVDTRNGLLQGGDSGPAIDEANHSASLLWDAVSWADRDYQMPPKQKMPAEVISDFEEWLAMGAPDPRLSETIVVQSEVDIEEGRKHWAYQPVSRPEVPDTKDGDSWALDPIDHFVLAELEKNDLAPAEDAEAAVLLRRLNYDLNGIPPIPEEVVAFEKAWVEDPDAAIEAKVDELIGRSQFGERWGRHWLDVARYAESTGKDVNYTYPQAWRYRDYVIDSINEDKPYDRFLREQIAGDLLPIDSDEEWQENLIATGFLAVGTKNLNEANPRKFEMDLVDEQIDTVSQAVLGLTVSCARCHDHKFDAIPTTDYYALAGIFQSTETYYGTVRGAQNQRPTPLLPLPISDEEPVGKVYSEREMEALSTRLADLRQAGRAMRSENSGASVQERLRTRSQIEQISYITASLNPDGTPITNAMAVQDSDIPSDARVLERGEVERPGQEVARGVLQVVNFTDGLEIPEGQSGRIQLAQWLSSEQNPLTARVMVNRVWLWLFGEGLVASPNNWGVTGQAPSHPELLDHLAQRFMDEGWSLKTLVKNLVLTRTYRMSSDYNEAHYAVDPDNKKLWRASPRQLDAEALRDGMLAISGLIDYERPVGSQLMKFEGARAGIRVRPDTLEEQSHRSVYLPLVRNMLPESLTLFDFPDSSVVAEKRNKTNMPSQALYLMNSDFVTEQAWSMAGYLREQHESIEEQVRLAFLQAYCRHATSDEVAGCLRYFEMFEETATENDYDSGQIEELALVAFCQSLLCSAEFRILN